MPPMPSRMTKNQDRNIRYRPGKAAAEEIEDESESESDDEHDKASQPPAPRAPAPKASTFPAQKKLPTELHRVAHSKPSAPHAQGSKDEDLEGFVTASESSEDEARDDASGSGSSEDDEEESSEEESSSDDEPKRRMIAPKFISKAQREKQKDAQPTRSADEINAEEERRRKEKADELLQAQIERDAIARSAGRKAWDDDDDTVQEEVNDTDGLDLEAEKTAWKLRELKRVRRDRLALVEKEKELEEIERRKNLSAEEREAEDREFLEQQKAERDGRGKMGFMQKYYHKGAFFHGDEEQDEEVKAALSRDLAGARYEDDLSKETLPEYMKIRDMARLGRKGRTKYKDLKSEDTGRWGAFNDKRRNDDGLDDRFRSDDRGNDERDRTGANAAPVGERRRREDDGNGERSDKRRRYS